MSIADLAGRRDQLLRSVDAAVGEFLVKSDDPLALACYLWVIRRHRLTLSNGDALLGWAASWIQEVLVEGRVGRRRDEELTSAALAAAALADAPTLSSSTCDAVRRRLGDVLCDELRRRELPFGHPAYAAMLLFAARRLEVKEERFPSAAQAVVTAFLEALPNGHLLGLGFVVQLLSAIEGDALSSTVRQHALDAAGDQRLDPEQQVYLAQSLWYFPEDGILPATVEDLTRRVIEYPHLQSGTDLLQEKASSTDDLKALTPYSHLAQAAQLDVFLTYRQGAQRREELRKDRMYRGRGWVTTPAFGFYAIMSLGSWLAVAWLALPWADDSWRYWIQGDYDGIRSMTALLLLSGVLLVSYFATITPAILWTLFSTLVLNKVESNRRLLDLLLCQLVRVSKWWILGVLIVIAIGVFTNIITPGFEHIISGD